MLLPVIDRSDEIVSTYLAGHSRSEVVKRLGITEHYVRRTLEERGVMRSQRDATKLFNTCYTVNEHFFDSIDTLEKCWALGWFYTDGYNRVNPPDARISLNEKDEDVLIKLNDLFGNTRPLQREPKYHRTTLIVSRRPFSEALARHGCVQAKSLIVQYPHHLLDTRQKTCAFLRGVLEGDGCMHVDNATGHGYVVVTIASGSLSFVESLKRVFQEMWGLEGHIMMRSGKLIGIRFRKNPVKLLRMLDDIYNLNDLSLYLNRKYTTYQSMRPLLLTKIANH